MNPVFTCDLCDKAYIRQGNLARHKAKHSVVEGADQVAEVVAPLVQVAADQVVDAPLFENIVLPAEFPDFDEDYLALIDIEFDIDHPMCGNCDDKDEENKNLRKMNEKLLRKVIALEKAQKILRKAHKDQKNETENARQLLDQTTKVKLVEKQKVLTKKATQKVIDVEEEAEPVVEKCKGNGLWQCETCDFFTENKFAMKAHTHLNVHTSRPIPVEKKKQTVLLRTFQCEKCDTKCFDESELKYHMENEHRGPIPCRNGDSCRFMASGRCKFTHREVVEEGWEEVHRRGRRAPTTTSRNVQPCKYDDFCTKGRFCAFTHSKWRSSPIQSTGSRFQFFYTEEDFPSLQSIRRNF